MMTWASACLIRWIFLELSIFPVSDYMFTLLLRYFCYCFPFSNNTVFGFRSLCFWLDVFFVETLYYVLMVFAQLIIDISRLTENGMW